MGYVEEQPGLIAQLLPKTLAGLSVWILMFAMGVAASGIVLFAYYQYNLAAIREEMAEFNVKFEKEFEKKSEEFGDLVEDSKAEIEKAAQGAGSQSSEIKQLLEKVGPSIAHVSGVDANNAPGSGSGFIVTSNNNESWVLTNLKIVAGSASQRQPVRVRLGNSEREGTVWSWDDRRDLALIILKTGNLPVLEWESSEPEVGSLVWAIGTGAGKLGAVASQGHVMDSGSSGYLVDSDVPASSLGGPLLTKSGKVLGVLTANYAPEGLPPSPGWVVPIRQSCQKVLRCPS